MRMGLLLMPALALFAAAGIRAGAVSPTPAPALPGVTNPAQARVDYMLKCQGCHRPDGTGDPRSTPAMKGVVARFLHVPGGREFLGRVPGVATVDLDDRRLANLLNWTLFRFDADNVPRDFRPYTATEIAKLRANPLRIERAEARRVLAEQFE